MIKGSLDYYQDSVRLSLKKSQSLNIMAVPHIDKIVLNMGLGKAKDNKNIITDAVKAMTSIAGQKPLVTKAKNSIAGFKIREDMDIGLKVTLRRHKMYDFLIKLIHVQLPRVKDFQGLSVKSFDGRGNYTFGLKDVGIFVELSKFHSNLVEGLSVSLITSAKSNDDSKRLLEQMGLPFSKR